MLPETQLDSSVNASTPDTTESVCAHVHDIATIAGTAVTELPQDLYIPPNALRIFLEAFSGPLDLLLYLIKKQNLNILDIPIAKISAQYMEYIDLMQQLQLGLAAEYLLMAAMLAEIKSRLLLPRPEAIVEDSEVDPRADLVRRLQEYERFKKAADDLDALPRLERDFFVAAADVPVIELKRELPPILLQDLTFALKAVFERAAMHKKHQIKLDSLSVRERMSNVLQLLQSRDGFAEFTAFFDVTEGKSGVVVTFIAMLELLKQAAIEVVQAEYFGKIYLKISNYPAT